MEPQSVILGVHGNRLYFGMTVHDSDGDKVELYIGDGIAAISHKELLTASCTSSLFPL